MTPFIFQPAVITALLVLSGTVVGQQGCGQAIINVRLLALNKHQFLLIVPQFDRLSSPSTPSEGYFGLNFDGWQVSTLADAGIPPNYPITTKPNIAYPQDALLNTIKINNGSATGFKLQSFNLACIGIVPGTENQEMPELMLVNCTVAVTMKLPFSTVLYQYTGATKNPKMQRFTSTQQGSEAHFSIVGAPVGKALVSDTAFYIDRMVITDTGTCGGVSVSSVDSQEGGNGGLFGGGSN
jgi:hypothetical protein